MVRIFLGIVVAFYCALAISPASAIYLSESGDRAYLTGSIDPGDEKAFASFLAQPRSRPLRVIYLDSFGGAVDAAVRIGRQIRQAKLATAVDALGKHCVSACTLLFAAGTQRYNIHGEGVEEGYNALSGLAYHNPWTKENGRAAYNSEKGLAVMRAFYAEMGAPGTAEILSLGRGSSVYHPSGQTTLRLHIATSLAEP